MCGAYGFSVKDAKELYDRFEVVNRLDDFEPHFKIIAGVMNPVITSHSPNKISRMFWGLIPYWASDEKNKFSTINAKTETVAQLATYKRPFREKRCLTQSMGFMNLIKFIITKDHSPGIISSSKIKESLHLRGCVMFGQIKKL